MPVRHPLHASLPLLFLTPALAAALGLASLPPFVGGHLFTLDAYRPLFWCVGAYAAPLPPALLLGLLAAPSGLAGPSLLLTETGAPLHAAGLAAFAIALLACAWPRRRPTPPASLGAALAALICLGGAWVATSSPRGLP